MKNFSKTLISMAAVMAVGSAMAVSAFASMSASYENGTLTVTGASTHGDKQTIMLVAGTNADGVTAETDTYDATGGENGTIKHINQDDTASADFNGDISVQALADGNYKLMVSGSDGNVESVTFTVGKDIKPDIVIIGDVSGDKNIMINDVMMVARVAQSKTTGNRGTAGVTRTLYSDPTKTVMMGDCSGDKNIMINDVMMVARVAQSKATGNRGDAEKSYEVMPITATEQ